MTKKRKSKKPIQMSDFQMRVMAEYESSGIWVIGKVGVFRHSMIGHSSLNLPAELSQRFKQWIEYYWGNLDYPEFAHMEFDRNTFNQEGRELAQALKQHVGPECYVEFVPETDAGVGKAEVIGFMTSTEEAQI